MGKSALLQQILLLKQKGYTNKQIISGLASEGHSMKDIQEAMVQAELKRIVEEQNNKLNQQPAPALPAPTQNQPIINQPTNQPSIQTQTQTSTAPVEPSQQETTPQPTTQSTPSLPSSFFPLPPPDISVSSSETTSNTETTEKEIIAKIKPELERMVEIIVAEKLKQYEAFADEVKKSQSEVSSKIKELEGTTKRLDAEIKRNNDELIKQTETLNQHIQKLTAQLVAMGDVFEKVIPIFIDNVKKLTVITDKVSDYVNETASTKSKKKKK